MHIEASNDAGQKFSLDIDQEDLDALPDEEARADFICECLERAYRKILQ